MKLSEFRRMIEAGLTDDQIRVLLKTEQPKQEPEEKNKSDMAGVILALNELKETIQASNIDSAKSKEPETVEDILESLIIDE